jgi:hypothetical protein
VLAVLDVEDELTQEGLMVVLAERLVALGEVVPFLISSPSRASISFGVSSRPWNPDFSMAILRAFVAS